MKSIVVVANCQSDALKKTLAEVLPEWTISAYGVHLQHSKAVEDQTQQNLEKADFIVTQPFKKRFSFDVDQFQDGSKSQVIRFPSIYFKGQHPTLTQLRVDGKPVDTPGFVYHDGIIAELVNQGATDEAILDQMTCPALFSRNFVENQWRSSLDALKKREVEDTVDIPVTGLIENHFRTERLFNTFNHPTRRVLSHVANAILKHIGVARQVPVDGEDYLNYPVHPILPSVAHHLDKGALSQDQRFHWATKSLGYDDFVLLQAKRFRSLAKGELDAALASTVGLADVIAAWRADHRNLTV